jgi:tetraacyldisaccharide 4'-kinase
VGNLVVGGAGKTPVTLSLVPLLRAQGWQPIVVTRGYGGRLKGPLWVDALRHTVEEVGDEALLLAPHVPVVVARRRADVLALLPQRLKEAPRTLILLDDGHQQMSLFKDLSLLVVDGQQGHGNGCVLPAGPLREPLSQGLRRAHGIVWIGENPPASLPFSLPLFQARVEVSAPLALGTRVVGFAGLGYPQKFQKSLVDLGLEVCDFIAFPDHFPYTPQALEKVAVLCARHGATPVTTTKDFVRLPETLPESLQGKIVRVQMEILWDNASHLNAFLREKVCPF